MNYMLNQSAKNFVVEYLKSASQEDKKYILNHLLTEMGEWDTYLRSREMETALSAGATPAPAPPPPRVVPMEVEYIPVGMGMVQPRVVPVEVEEAKAEPDWESGDDSGEEPTPAPEDGLGDAPCPRSMGMRWKIYLHYLPAIITNDPETTLLSMTPTRIEWQEWGYTMNRYVCSDGTYLFNTRGSLAKKICKILRRNFVNTMKLFDQETDNNTWMPVRMLNDTTEIFEAGTFRDIKIKNVIVDINGIGYQAPLFNVFPPAGESVRPYTTERAERTIELNMLQGYTPQPRRVREVAPAPRVLFTTTQAFCNRGEGECPVCMDETQTGLSVCGHPLCSTCYHTINAGGNRKCPLCRMSL